MNVIELIEKLESYEPTRQVVIWTNEADEVDDIRDVKLADQYDERNYHGPGKIADCAVILEA